MKVLAVSYGKNAVGVNSKGVANTGRRSAPAGAVLAPGYSTAKKEPDRTGLCVGNDNTCGARQAKGTEWCAGHLRSRGEL
jgi:hypothetical protein